MINKYLKELVENNNRIIIPDFGAFMIQNTPEGKQISFNDFLKFNDGLLVNQIIKAEKISKTDATYKIKDFVFEISKAFAKNEAFEIEGVGFLIKDANGNIKFEKEKTPAKPATPKKEEKPTIELDEKQPIKKEPAKKVEKKTETVKPAAAKLDNDNKKVEVNKTEPVKPVIKEEKPEAKAEPKKTEAPKPSVTTTKVHEKPKAEPVKPVVQQKTAEEIAAEIVNKKKKTNTEMSKSTKTILIIAAAIIILGGGGYALYHFGVFPKSEPVAVVVPEPTPEPVIDTIPEVDTTAVIEEPMVVEEPEIDPNAKRYYIVAGSFKVATNADNYNQKLIDEGYKSEIVVRSNGFHTVSYKTLYDWNEALKEWRTMRNTNEQTWILVK